MVKSKCTRARELRFSSVQSLSSVRLFSTPWTAACQASLSFDISWSLLKPMFIESVMPSKHLILCHPLILLPSIFLDLKVFSNELALSIRWLKYWSFSFGISPSNEYSGLLSFRTDWFDLLAVQGTLKSLLQHHNSKKSIFQHSALFTAQLSYSYMTTRIMRAFTTLSAKQCLCFWIGCLGCHSFSSKEQMSFNFMAAVTVCSDFGTQGNKICHCFHFFPIYLPWDDGTRCHYLRFLELLCV